MTTTSYTETYDLSTSGAIDDLALTGSLDTRFRTALDHADDPLIDDADRANATEALDEIEQAITAQLREHGVDTDTGEWLGDWSAEHLIDAILTRHGL